MKEKNLEFDLNLIVHSNIFYIEYWRLTLLKVFAKFAKEERGGVLENSRKKICYLRQVAFVDGPLHTI